MSRPITDATLRLIKEFEGFRSHPYRDPVGVWTVGYGETKGVTSSGPVLTEPEASRLLARRLENDYAPYVDRIGIPLNDNERGALISFVYNLGPGMIGTGHTMGDALRRRDYRAASRAFGLYVYAGGTKLPGLVRRREAERKLFDTPAELAMTEDERKIAKWKKELDAIRLYIHRHGGTWHNHPIRWARAKRLKAAIIRHGGKP